MISMTKLAFLSREAQFIRIVVLLLPAWGVAYTKSNNWNRDQRYTEGMPSVCL
jgi:hypothetical protein